MKGCNKGDGKMVELPPGFRFHPTDEELVTHYLSPKVHDCSFTTRAVGEVDLNKVEPWDLPWRASIGEKEWYFFCMRDRKYPTGSRTNRATDAGYWKATGKDKEIFRAKILVGMKKTLVFYRGRSPRGEKTNWVMHEYRLQRNNSSFFPKTDEKGWVICRVFKKSSGGNEVHTSGLVRTDDPYLDLPTLIDVSSDQHSTNAAEVPHVTCFKQDPQDESVDGYSSASNTNSFCPNSIFSTQTNPFAENSHCPDFISKQEQTTLCHLFKTHSPQNAAAEFSQDLGSENDKVSPSISGYEDAPNPYLDYQDLSTIISTEQIHIDCLWNY